MEQPGTTAGRDWSGASPIRYPDPAIRILDPRFKPYALGHTPVQRLYTRTLCADAPCWLGDGRYLLWSDIPNHPMLRCTEEPRTVSLLRHPPNPPHPPPPHPPRRL